MTGYICIAMLEDPPYNMIVGMTEHDPEDWCDELPLPSHLLYFQSFIEKMHDAITKGAVQSL